MLSVIARPHDEEVAQNQHEQRKDLRALFAAVLVVTMRRWSLGCGVRRAEQGGVAAVAFHRRGEMGQRGDDSASGHDQTGYGDPVWTMVPKTVKARTIRSPILL